MTLLPLKRDEAEFHRPFWVDLASLFSRLLHQLPPTPEAVVLVLAVLIGIGAGAGVVMFHLLITWVHDVMMVQVMGVISAGGAWTLACVPILGGLVVGLLRWRIGDLGPGIQALMAIARGTQPATSLKPVAKMVVASISLGSGASLGPEGPSVEIGSTFGLLLGQVLKVSRERQQLLLGAGAAAGLAAGFNAPIAGVFFALEVILGTTFATSAVSVVLLAAVVAAWIAQMGLGAKPAFTLPVYEVLSPLELPLYVGLGLLASLISLAYGWAVDMSQRSFQGKLPAVQWLGLIPVPLQPLLGGLCIGLAALQWPQVMGVGYETIEAMLQDVKFSLGLLLVLLVVKLVVTAISAGSGFVGGLFAPAMFLGASLGGAYGKILTLLFPWLHGYMAGPPAYAMVGMAAVLAGTVRAPLTAILLLFEMTRDYRIVLPLMAAVGLSVWLAERWHSPPVRSVTEPPRPEVKPEPEPYALAGLLVTDAMRSQPLLLPDSMVLAVAGQELIDHRQYSALVMGATGLVGIITLEDLHRLTAKSNGEVVGHQLNQSLADCCSTTIIHAYADEPLTEAIARMSARGLHQLPVVDRQNTQQVVGILDKEGIALAQTIARAKGVLAPPEPLTDATVNSDTVDSDSAAHPTSEAPVEPPVEATANSNVDSKAIAA